MKRMLFIPGLLCACYFFSTAQVAITIDSTLPHPTAMLDIKSNSKGVLIPRLTSEQIKDINNPARGLLIFQTDGEAGFYYNAGTEENVEWKKVGESSSLPASSIILSETQVNTALSDAGFVLAGKIRTTFAGYGASGSWVPISMNNIVDVNGIADASAIWTGSEMIIWGGDYSGNTTSASGFKNKGHRYNPLTDSWTSTNETGAPVGRFKHIAAWTPNNRMLIFGGHSEASSGANVPYNDGALYDPLSNMWGPLFSTVNAPDGFQLLNRPKVYDGNNRIFCWGWYVGSAFGKMYTISTNTWSDISLVNAPSERQAASAVWMGGSINKLLVWGGYTPGSPFVYHNTGKIYDPVSNTWTNVATPPAAIAACVSPVLQWTGTEVFLYGGSLIGGDIHFNHAAKYNPATNTWATISSIGKPSERFAYATQWADNKFLIWGGFEKQLGDVFVRVNSGAVYNNATNTWTEIPLTTNTPDERSYPYGAWNGAEWMIWGGGSASGRTGALSGGRYNPSVTGSTFGAFQTKDYYLFRKN